MILLDASVLIAFQDSENANYQRAVDLIVSMDESYIFVSEVTWAEVLVGAIIANEVEDAVDGILRELGVAVINPEGSDWPLLLAEARARTGLKMPDAIIIATAEILGAQVATLDKRLAKVAAKEGLLYEPDGE